MNARLWRNEADIVLVYKLDRIFRSLSDCIQFLQEWNNRGIDFVSLKDPGLNMTTPTGKLMLHLIGAFAEFEASLIRMRVKAGLENARAKEVNSEWFPVWATALHTGMRNGELYALTWDKIDFENRRIKVDCSWNKLDGIKSTKSGDDRWVGISSELEEIFRELKMSDLNPPFVLPRVDKWSRNEQGRELRMFY